MALTANRATFTGELKMTQYEKMMNKADECTSKAIAAKDVNIKAFYYNASKGYEMKAKNLTIKEGMEQVK